ncbi:hypothetical protein V0R37_05340 [Pollutimonas sp. H1-120]
MKQVIAASCLLKALRHMPALQFIAGICTPWQVLAQSPVTSRK